MKWWSVWETPKRAACGPKQSVITPSTNSSRLAGRPAPLNIDTNSRRFCARSSINCNKMKLYLKLLTYLVSKIGFEIEGPEFQSQQPACKPFTEQARKGSGRAMVKEL